VVRDDLFFGIDERNAEEGEAQRHCPDHAPFAAQFKKCHQRDRARHRFDGGITQRQALPTGRAPAPQQNDANHREIFVPGSDMAAMAAKWPPSREIQGRLPAFAGAFQVLSLPCLVPQDGGKAEHESGEHGACEQAEDAGRQGRERVCGRERLPQGPHGREQTVHHHMPPLPSVRPWIGAMLL